MQPKFGLWRPAREGCGTLLIKGINIRCPAAPPSHERSGNDEDSYGKRNLGHSELRVP